VLTRSDTPGPKRGVLETVPSAALMALSVGTGLFAAYIVGAL